MTFLMTNPIQNNSALHIPPQHPLHEGLVLSQCPPSSRSGCNQHHTAGVLGWCRSIMLPQGPLYENKISSMKPEVHRILQCQQTRTEPWSQAMWTENLVKFVCEVSKICSDTDRPTDRQYSSSLPWWSNKRNNESSYWERGKVVESDFLFHYKFQYTQTVNPVWNMWVTHINARTEYPKTTPYWVAYEPKLNSLQLLSNPAVMPLLNLSSLQ